MQAAKRGEPLLINQALNKPREKLGLNLPTWLAIVMVCVMAFLAGFRLLAVVSFPLLATGCWFVVRKQPKMFQLWALIRAVAAAFIFVWGGFMNAFLQQTFNGNYSMEMWLANLIPCIMVFVAFIVNMLFIPSMTQAIFGGAAGLTGAAAQLAGGAAALAIKSGA